MALLHYTGFETMVEPAEGWTWPSNSSASPVVLSGGRNGGRRLRVQGHDSGYGYLDLSSYGLQGNDIYFGVYAEISSYTQVSTPAIWLQSATYDLRIAGIDATNGGIWIGPSTRISTLWLSGYIEIWLRVSSDPAVGRVVIRQDEVVKVDWRGVTQLATAFTTPAIRLGSYGTNFGRTYSFYDDIYLCDGMGGAPFNGFLGDVSVQTLHPTAVGKSSDFALDNSGVAGMTKPQALSDPTTTTGFVSSSTGSAEDSYQLQDVPFSSLVYAVRPFVVGARNTTDSGPGRISPTLDMNSSKVVFDPVTLTPSANATTYTVAQGPIITGGLSTPGVNAAEAGMRLESASG